jgi:hypothetical protein
LSKIDGIAILSFCKITLNREFQGYLFIKIGKYQQLVISPDSSDILLFWDSEQKIKRTAGKKSLNGTQAIGSNK